MTGKGGKEMRTRYLAVCLLLIAAMCAATLYCWLSLSERVPVHWNVEGVADGWRWSPVACSAYARCGSALRIGCC